METIKNYLDNMFANLPKTNQIRKLKNDLLANMEDKYNELKSNGKSENEAIGIVISEFGNIDELMNEFGIEYANETNETNETDEASTLPIITEDKVNDYLITYKKSAKIVGIGVFLCILGAALLILNTQLIEDGFIGSISGEFSNVFGLISLFVLVAIAVGLFIYNGMIMEKFKYIENGVELPMYVREAIQQKNDAFTPTYTLSVIIGVTLCILSPIILFITSSIGDNASTYGVVVLMSIVGAAVFIFIYYGMIRDSFKKLLRDNENYKFSSYDKRKDKVIGAVAAVVWPLATCIYLIIGFVFGGWHPGWIIFPITALLFSVFSAAYNILNGKDE